MTTSTAAPAGGDVALTRAALYELCVITLAYPSPEGDQRFREMLGAVAALRPGDTALAQSLRALHDAAPDELAADLAIRRDAHAGVFTFVESQDCPPYETAYRTQDIFRQVDLMADIAGFYRAHGLVTGGHERERPDHASTELEFLGFLARKEAHAWRVAGPDEVETCRETSDVFLRDHAGCWLRAFGRRVASVTPSPFLSAAGRLVTAWIDVELATAGVVPAEICDDAEPFPPPDDGGCGVVGNACPETGAKP